MADDDLTARLTLALDTESETPAVYTELIGDVAPLWAWLRTLDSSLPDNPPTIPPDTLGDAQPTVRANACVVRDGHGVVTVRVSVALAPAAVERAKELIPMFRFAATMMGAGGGGEEPEPGPCDGCGAPDGQPCSCAPLKVEV